MEHKGDKIMLKLCSNFYCKICDYTTCKKSSFDNHNLSRKHHKLTLGDAQGDTNYAPKISSNKLFNCTNCDKPYMSRNGLWKHQKMCLNNSNNTSYNNNEDPTDKQLMMMLMKDNSELKHLIMEVVKNGTHITNNNTNTTTNSHNKTFNLQVFLNETCKDAMNIMDFVDSIKLQLSDFERVGEVGFVNGISDIIIKNLKQLDITERPIHCTDKKRAIMYVKDDDKWEKDDDTNRKVRRAIKYIANKNIKLMDAYKALYPDCQKSHSKYSDSYNKFVIEALGGSGNEDCDNEDKIISRLSKVVTIEK